MANSRRWKQLFASLAMDCHPSEWIKERRTHNQSKHYAAGEQTIAQDTGTEYKKESVGQVRLEKETTHTHRSSEAAATRAPSSIVSIEFPFDDVVSNAKVSTFLKMCVLLSFLSPPVPLSLLFWLLSSCTSSGRAASVERRRAKRGTSCVPMRQTYEQSIKHRQSGTEKKTQHKLFINEQLCRAIGHMRKRCV